MNTANHYHQPDLLESILSKLKELGLDQKPITRQHLAAMDEFHLQGSAVSEELAGRLDLTSDSTVLDVGCGIGGPCRMLADDFGCTVTGIDYTEEYVRAARALTQIVRLTDKVEFQQANALQLPFEDETFGVVWTQHAQMNIADKAKFYSEIQRVLQPGGKFVYYDIFGTNEGEVYYPVPWAEVPENSHLIIHESVAGYFPDEYYQLEYSKDHTPNATDFLSGVLEKIRSGEAPQLGLNLLMRESTGKKLGNLLRCLREGKVEVYAGVYLKK
ncbi:MAG: class I SAM-dependent methyltransferase [Cyclobacteriaceae bacterium]